MKLNILLYQIWFKGAHRLYVKGTAVHGRIDEGTDGHLWQFESVGGLGSSIVVSLVEPDETSDAPRFVCARRVIGVLYTV
jgi:hypothetical protein